MLSQGRYTWRHDNVLLTIKNHITGFVNSDYILCDADTTTSWTIPSDILVTKERPDLVILDRLNFKIFILEL